MPTLNLSVTPVTTRSLHKEFRDFPYQLYGSDPYWVPPLRRLEDQRWSPEHNPSLRQRWCQRWLVRRQGQVVGRVAAVIDEEFARRWAPGAGWFGFFECTPDPEAARALLETAAETLVRQGRTWVLGPVNLTMHDEVGLLVEGHHARPMLLSPYNPPYYEQLIRGCGFTPRCDYHAYAWSTDRPQTPAVQRLRRRLSPSESLPAGMRLRPSHPRRWKEDARVLWELYNASFTDTWGFVPLCWEEFEERASQFRRFYIPELVQFAEVAGQPVGFALILPDVNAALAGLGGRFWPLGWLRLALRMPRVRTGRLILLGVLPNFRGAGLAALLAHGCAEAARRLGFCRGELSLVHGDNRPMRHVIDAFGGQQCKTYRLFEKPLASSAAGLPSGALHGSLAVPV
ncbi:MAG: GNAT family N-acetyltransferase [Planctomycetes bacterium]|nr:GNAT family N-acetyltransferase [Planctomycetota bacterium]